MDVLRQFNFSQVVHPRDEGPKEWRQWTAGVVYLSLFHLSKIRLEQSLAVHAFIKPLSAYMGKNGVGWDAFFSPLRVSCVRGAKGKFTTSTARSLIAAGSFPAMSLPLWLWSPLESLHPKAQTWVVTWPGPFSHFTLWLRNGRLWLGQYKVVSLTPFYKAAMGSRQTFIICGLFSAVLPVCSSPSDMCWHDEPHLISLMHRFPRADQTQSHSKWVELSHHLP